MRCPRSWCSLGLWLAVANAAWGAEPVTPAEWVEAVRTAAAGEATRLTQTHGEAGYEAFRDIRLGAGVFITHSYRPSADVEQYAYAEACRGFARFMRARGEKLLARVLAGDVLGAQEKPYRRIVLAVYLWHGHAQSQRKGPPERFYALPLDAEGKAAAKAMHERAVEQGQTVLRRGYRTGRLAREDVEAIHLYRIVQGMRGVGECFLPAHLGLHPYCPSDRPRSAGHGVPAVRRASVNKPFHDLVLPTLQAVRARPDYTDLPDSRYGYEYPLRDEGVLEFLGPMVGYVPATSEDGGPVVVPRLPAEDPAPGTAERLGDLVGDRPLLLFLNDGVDAPFGRAIGMVPVLMQAWADHARWRFIAVNIHDWHYAAGDFRDYLHGPGAGAHHHAWSVEERARRFSMRLIQCPHVRVPSLVDNPYHGAKSCYAAGGGQNTYILVGTDGRMKFRSGGPFFPLNTANEMEHALARLVASGAGGGFPQESDPRTFNPPRPIVVIHHATLTEVEGSARTLDFEAVFGSAKVAYACRVPPHARVVLDGGRAALAELKPGDRLQVRLALDALGGFDPAFVPQQRPPWEGPSEADLAAGNRRITLRRVRDGYRSDYDLFVLRADGSPGPVIPREVRAWRNSACPADLTRAEALQTPRVTIWRGGRVASIDAEHRRVVVKPWPYDTQALTGRRIVAEHRAAGRQVHLDETARLRHACVERWIADAGKPETFYLDDAVDYTLNGLFGAGFDDLAVGDAVTIRYDCRHDATAPIPAELVRISRPRPGNGPSAARRESGPPDRGRPGRAWRARGSAPG